MRKYFSENHVFRSPKSREDQKKRSLPQFGTKFGWKLWYFFVLTGPFSSDQPALKSRWGTLNLDGGTCPPASLLQFKYGAYPILNIHGYMLYTRVGLNLNFEFESAHNLLMNLTFAKSMNLNLNVLIKYSIILIFSNQNLHCESNDL